MSTSSRRPIDSDHTPEIDAPDYRSDDIVGIIDGNELIIEDASDSPDGFARWLSIRVNSKHAVVNVADWR